MAEIQKLHTRSEVSGLAPFFRGLVSPRQM